MLALGKDVTPSVASVVEHGSAEEENDSWVLVKKQRITILVPPPSPAHPQTNSPEGSPICTQPRKIVIGSSNAQKKRRRKNSTSQCKKPTANHSNKRTKSDGETNNYTVVPSQNEVEFDGARSRANESHHSSVIPLDHREDVLPFSMSQERSDHLGDGNIVFRAKKRTFEFSEKPGSASRMLVGALNVVNLQVRALNLERKLKRVGGLRRWLISQGLDRFIGVLEREKLGKYQLVSLTMDKLKDMGTDAVGPRRKLIHAIDNLCQPYYCKDLQ